MRMGWIFCSRLLPLALGLAQGACSPARAPRPDRGAVVTRAQKAQPAPRSTPSDPAPSDGPSAAPDAVVAEDPARIPDAVMAELRSLELSPSPGAPAPPDAGGSGSTGAEAPPACGPSLADLGRRAPHLERLVLVGCGDLAARGLAEGAADLTELVLRRLDLSAEDVEALGRLPRLSRLELDEVATTGEIPLRSVAAAPIRSLVLRDLPPRTPLVGLVPALADTLTELVLEGRWADSRTLIAARTATGLERLEVVGTRAGNYGLHALAGHDRLREVVLEGAGFTNATPLYLRKLPVRAFACTCPNLGDTGVAHLRHLEGLERLTLVEPGTTPDGLAHLGRLPALREIVLDGVVLSDAAVEALGGLEHLATLEVRSGTLDARTLAPLGGASRLERLVLRVDGLDDARAGTLPALPALRHLDVAGTAVTDAALPALARHDAVETLDLSGTRVTRRLAPLAQLRNLRTLRLAETDVVDDGVRALADLARLERLDLRSTLVSAAILDTLAALPALASVDLRGTSVPPEAAARVLGARGIEVRAGPDPSAEGP